MRKLFKISVIALGVLMAVVLLLTGVLHWMYPPARLRAMVQEQLRKQLHRESQIGPVDLGFWGISLERLKLSDVPDFNAGTFLFVEKAQVHWALMPLLHHQIVVRDIVFQSPQVNLVRHANGKTLNVSDLQGAAPITQGSTNRAPPTQPATPAAETKKSDWSWKINEIRLKNALINFNDLSPAGMTTTLSAIDLSLKDLTETHAEGSLTVGRIQNTVYTAKDFNVEWLLGDIDPRLTHVNGKINLKQGPGLVQNLNKLAASSKSAQLVFMPLLMLQNLDHLGIVKLGLPDFSHLVIDSITGEYVFTNGTMTIQTFAIQSATLQVDAKGTIELASEKLSVDVHLQTPQKAGPMSVQLHISGTLSNPQTDLNSLKKQAFKATVSGLLNNPDTKKEINKALKSLFH
jgi:uncharacterized protein involved in outer membrane biogenesis